MNDLKKKQIEIEIAKKIAEQGNCNGVSCHGYSFFSPKQKVDCPFTISICNGCINTAGQIKEVEAWIAVKEGESYSSLYKPLEVERLEIAGLKPAMAAMRLPKGTLSDSESNVLGKIDAELAGRLIRAGNDHAKSLRGIIVWIALRMQVGWMIEFETYRHGVECLSTSSTMHGELKGLSGTELVKKKQADLPGKVYTRIYTMSYQVLRTIYRARRKHRHPDWQIFCRFVEDLPLFKYLIYPEARK